MSIVIERKENIRISGDTPEYDKDRDKYHPIDLETSTETMPYVDREVSWLKFNERVMSLVSNHDIPLLERVKFLSIVNSNLDEFFTIRVSSRLKEKESHSEVDIDRIINTDEQSNISLSKILKQSKLMLGEIDDLYRILKDELYNLGKIRINGPVLDLDTGDLDMNIQRDSEMELKKEKYFLKNIFPSLTPLIIDTTRPLPHLKPFSIYIALIVKPSSDDDEKIGLVEIPPHLDRMVSFNDKSEDATPHKQWFFIEDIIIDNLVKLYPGIEYYDITAFRILRDGDSDIDDNIAFHESSYVEHMVSHVRSRILYNDTIRVDIWGNPRKKILNMLKDSLDISKKFIFHSMTRLKMSDIMQIYSESKDEELKYPEFNPIKPFKNYKSNKTMFNAINKQDIMVHHPYESFNDTVLRFVAEACFDPHVVSIKQTLYRSGNESKILEYLLRAAQSGKNVVVVMELKARFDEETNIEWADKLKKAGAIVVYGYEHIKTHAKMMHVFRLKDGDAQQFVHIGTGNYSEKNAKVYTDFSYFTSSRKICQDVSMIFNMLTGGIICESVQLNHIKISPIMTRQFLYDMIDREIVKSTDLTTYDKGYILIKVNNLSDPALVNKFYEASQAGVKIDIICRGSCSLVPGIEGFSENITVRSIVGRFLEHSRILKFGIDGDKGRNSSIFITSSDLMTRNLDRRLELMFEISDAYKSEMSLYLETLLHDNVNAFEMKSEEYVKVERKEGEPFVDAQIGTYQFLKDLN